VAPDHVPALLTETLEWLAVTPGGFYVDGTVGLAGHAAEILRRSAPDGRLLGADRDSETLEEARAALAEFADRARLVHQDFRDLSQTLAGQAPNGILLDLGVSSVQLDRPERGFSFRADGPLDMRMDRTCGASAAQLVNRRSEPVLADLIHEFGEEPAARRIARAIVATRHRRPIASTLELAEVVRRAAGRGGRGRRRSIDPATRTFQALRIATNRELDGLGAAVTALAGCLAPRGRMAVIAFHSLEDREVKHAFRALGRCGFRELTRKPVRPGAEELRRNPRARSARLRAIEREPGQEGPR
jgi:16S rRNA (cytosine1402-N4)-methyltransferase